MIAKLTITPATNINLRFGAVVDKKKVRTITKKWTDVVSVWDIRQDEVVTRLVSDVSLFDHRLIEDGVQHRILHMFSRPT